MGAAVQVSELTSVFQIGPRLSALLQPSPLEERIDQGWWAAAGNGNGMAAGKAGAAGAADAGAQAAAMLWSGLSACCSESCGGAWKNSKQLLGRPPV